MRRKIKSKLNQQSILQLGIVTEMEYKYLVFDLGIQFLQELFQEDEHWFQDFSYSKSYWNWWMIEWHHQEDNMIKVMSSHAIRLTRQQWFEWMGELVHAKKTEHGFQNYLKHHQNEKLSQTTGRI